MFQPHSFSALAGGVFHTGGGGTLTQSLDADDKNLAEFSSRMEGEKRNFIVDYHSYYSINTPPCCLQTSRAFVSAYIRYKI